MTGRRADGYHTLRSIFVRLVLHDHLEVRPAADPAGPDELVIEDHAAGAAPHVPGPGDLILRAAAALRVAYPGRRLPALRFRLDKHIPVAAGLAGGSSDAAAALELAAAAWELVVDRPELLALAAGVGADVPFFVANHAAALVGGVGEVFEGLPAPHPPAGILLVTRGRPAPDGGRLRRAGPHGRHARLRGRGTHHPGARPGHGGGPGPGGCPAIGP